MFDFEVQLNRSGIGNMKDTFSRQTEDGVPLLVLSGAEMDFATAPVIRDALQEFAQRGSYGFTLPDEAYCTSIRTWMERVRNLHVEAEDIVPTLGTIFALGTAVRAFTAPKDSVIIQHPSYYRHDVAVEKNGRTVVSNPLLEKNGVYAMDFKDLEEKMRNPRNKMLVLCNPHNPTGRVFSEDDLRKIAELANQYGTIVFSDEIFAEITFESHRAVSYAAIDAAHALVSTSLGKAFSLTGVNQANMIIPNPALRQQYLRQRHTDHFGSIDPFFYCALRAGYSEEGQKWLEQMKAHVWENYQALRTAVAHDLPKISLSSLEGGYVAWLDFRRLGMSGKELSCFLENQVSVLGDPGEEYGPGGNGFFRFNLATPRKNLSHFITNLKQAYAQLADSKQERS